MYASAQSLDFLDLTNPASAGLNWKLTLVPIMQRFICGRALAKFPQGVLPYQISRRFRQTSNFKARRVKVLTDIKPKAEGLKAQEQNAFETCSLRPEPYAGCFRTHNSNIL
jgi:hypothetical protein